MLRPWAYRLCLRPAGHVAQPYAAGSTQQGADPSEYDEGLHGLRGLEEATLRAAWSLAGHFMPMRLALLVLRHIADPATCAMKLSVLVERALSCPQVQASRRDERGPGSLQVTSFSYLLLLCAAARFRWPFDSV